MSGGSSAQSHMGSPGRTRLDAAAAAPRPAKATGAAFSVGPIMGRGMRTRKQGSAAASAMKVEASAPMRPQRMRSMRCDCSGVRPPAWRIDERRRKERLFAMSWSW